jgi:hypothetical protein
MQNKRVVSNMSMGAFLKQPNGPRLRQYSYMY